MVAGPNNLVAVDALNVTTAGAEQFHQLNAVPDSGFLQPVAAFYPAVLSLRFYADPGTVITCEAQTPNTNPVGGLLVSCVISGYFVTLP